MKKVIYSVRKAGYNSEKITGVGYVTDKDLVIACISKNGKPYIRIFENCIEQCNQVSDKPNEFKGTITEYREVDIERFTSSGASTGYETKEVEITYYIWFKYAD